MPANWAKVGDAITDRLAELGMQQKVLSARSDVSTAVIREIQRGKERRRHPRVLQSLSKALGWQANHLQDVLEGRQPEQQPRGTEALADGLTPFLKKLLFILEHRMGEIVDVIYHSDSNVNITIEIRHAPSES